MIDTEYRLRSQDVSDQDLAKFNELWPKVQKQAKIKPKFRLPSFDCPNCDAKNILFAGDAVRKNETIIVQGDPGDGKSTFLLTIAAKLTNGEILPFSEPETPPEPMKVIYQTTEDDADDTVVPRFIKAGGNRDRLVFIKEDQSPLTFADERIGDAIRETGAKLR